MVATGAVCLGKSEIWREAPFQRVALGLFEHAHGRVKRQRDVVPRDVGWIELGQDKCAWRAHEMTFLMAT